MKRTIHAAAGVIGMLTVLLFWTSTAISEAFLSQDAVVDVKRAILYGMLVLIPAMVAVGASGFSLADGRKGSLVDQKQRRMRIAALNGLVIMLPAAMFLDARASAGNFDTLFYTVQAIELSVGVLQLYLLGRNFRDGLRLSGRLAFPPAGS